MSISERDVKLLWGRAGGHCSAPNCPVDLLPLLARSGDVIVGEMAHVIGRRPGSARSDAAVGADDGYDNLILLCPSHHTVVDKAEADHPVEKLLKWKTDWEADVAERLMKRVSIGGRSSDLEMRLWTYFNFDVLLDLYRRSCPEELALGPIADLRADGLVSADAYPLAGRPSSRAPRTIFESWPAERGRELRKLYSGMVEELIHLQPPLDLDEVWGVRKLERLLYPTAIVFSNRLFTFNTVGPAAVREERRVQCRARGIQIDFQIDSWNIYSESALNLHFRGRSQILALLLVRSVDKPRDGGQVRLSIKATPIALGTGFHSAHDRTPTIARQRQFREEQDYGGQQPVA